MSKERVTEALAFLKQAHEYIKTVHHSNDDGVFCSDISCSNCTASYIVNNSDPEHCIFSDVHDWVRERGTQLETELYVQTAVQNGGSSGESEKDRFQMIKELMSKSPGSDSSKSEPDKTGE